MSTPKIESFLERFLFVRASTLGLCAPLTIEDHGVQAADHVSPPKWHLGHTTWFFETFVLTAFVRGYVPFDSRFGYLFNSYYEAAGPRQPRPQRGVLSRPGLEEVLGYRATIDGRMTELLAAYDGPDRAEILRRTELGLQHEQQHQELVLMDTKFNFWCSPLKPAYREDLDAGISRGDVSPPRFLSFAGGEAELGHDGEGFAFDNEGPRHPVRLLPFGLADRPVLVGEYLDFVEAGGYDDPRLWLSDGWLARQEHGWQAPLYWKREGDCWRIFTLGGMRDLDRGEPVCHVSFYEADAFARWANKRLPTEAEWEHAASGVPVYGNFVEEGALHPRPTPLGEGPRQVFGDVWELTQSPYVGYPGYRPPAGALGEYNGKFMVNQQVLRGGCALTPASHARLTYRNFFYPDQRWAMQGLRLAE